MNVRQLAVWLFLGSVSCGARDVPPDDPTPVAESDAAAADAAAPDAAAPDAAAPDAAVPDAAPDVPREPPLLSSVLRREPPGDGDCPTEFPKSFTWDPDAPGADEADLRRVVWLEPGHESDVPAISADEDSARAARCIARGPHRGLNLRNWCCRADADRPSFRHCVLGMSGGRGRWADGGATDTHCFMGAECIAVPGQAEPDDGFVRLSCDGSECRCTLARVFADSAAYTFSFTWSEPCSDGEIAKRIFLERCMEGQELEPAESAP